MSRLEQLRKLVQADPHDPLSHYGVGLELIQLQRYPEASAAFAEALRVDPSYVAAYYHKARAEAEGGMSSDARRTLHEGLQRARAAGDAKAESEMLELLGGLD